MPIARAELVAHTPMASAVRPGGSALGGFAGSITRRRPSALYRLGLAVVAMLLVLLPAVYVGLILLIGWGVWARAASPTGAGVWLVMLLYAGRLFVGLTVIGFLVKPLSAKRQAAPPAVALDPERERLLFAFIARICRLVGAPRPRRVQVNCVVNATAGFRRGLLSFCGQDLTLTVGLPLVAGLSMRQFAGVLAHEFGHFTQGAGLRLTYVMYQINYWFFRVVYERDEWDLWLDRAARTANVGSRLLVYAAVACIALSRCILWVLMHAGHAVSCFMLRQMEYDADRCNCQVAGSATFRETMVRIEELNTACEAASATLSASWQAQRLPDSLPVFLAGTSGTMPQEAREEVGRRVSGSPTGIFDTHPSHTDRIRAAAALDAPGVFRSTEPATALFRDFPSLSRRVTRLTYEKDQALDIRHRNLVDTETYLRESSVVRAAQALFARYFDEVQTVFRPVSISRADSRPAASADADLAELASARDRMKAAVPDARSANEELVRIEHRLINAGQALALAAAGFTFRPDVFELRSCSRESAARAIDRLEVRRKQSGAGLEEFSVCAGVRLSAALRQLDRPCHAGRIPDAPRLRAEVPGLVEALGAVAQVLPTLFLLGRTWSVCQVLLASRANHADPAVVDRVIGELVGRTWSHLTEVRLRIRGIAYPFAHARGAITLEQFVAPDALGGNQKDAILGEGRACLDRLFPLYHQLLCRLAHIAVQVEEALTRANPLRE